MEYFLIKFFASFFLWLLFAGIFILWVFDGKIKREQVLHALLAGVLAWGLAHLIKALFPTLRPFQLNNAPTMVIIPLTNGGFPSGHTAAAFGLALTIWQHNKKMGIIYLLSATLIGIARVLANVHYPVDILGGAVLGIITSLLIQRIHLKKLFGR